MNHMLLVAAGGAVGSVARYAVGVWAIRTLGPALPWGTFIVNIVGSFVIGLFAEMVAGKFSASPELRLLLITGFLGGFTTFSAFSLDAISLIERGASTSALIYVVGSVTLSIAAVIAGLALGRQFF
ncbi:fluoride efflux transporter CrcB [Rhizobium sp. CG5]|uniref:fluoride efflux transporter CrcB n=1 Tax=Rhizobium sp. CG5 TaxID=2726076 RepID=UPI0020338644|nr:fluoride efflux transporter CrcB [Rhizobium sp. CG5]MCM2474932.1 fluoride efflux transporter CrcB [Rhizobium sp. CG5]